MLRSTTKFTETFERYESLETCLKWAFCMKHCVPLTPFFKVRILIPLPRGKQAPSGACFLLLRRIKDSKNRYYEQSEQQGSERLRSGSYTSAITSEHSCSEAFLCQNTAFYGGIRAFFFASKSLRELLRD